jgi:hypothetical protein
MNLGEMMPWDPAHGNEANPAAVGGQLDAANVVAGSQLRQHTCAGISGLLAVVYQHPGDTELLRFCLVMTGTLYSQRLWMTVLFMRHASQQEFRSFFNCILVGTR